MRLVFAGEKTTKQAIRTSSNRASTRTKRDFIHRFELSVDGEKEYSGGEYPFEIQIPANVLQNTPEPEGTLGMVLKTAQFRGASTRIDWYLEASLDIPMRFDVKKKVQINVG